MTVGRDVSCALSISSACLLGGKSGGTAELLWLRPFLRDEAFLLYQGSDLRSKSVNFKCLQVLWARGTRIAPTEAEQFAGIF